MERCMVALLSDRINTNVRIYMVTLNKKIVGLLLEGCIVDVTKQKDYWWRDVWLLLQNRRTIDGEMFGCFYKKWLLKEICIVAFTKQDYWWKCV